MEVKSLLGCPTLNLRIWWLRVRPAPGAPFWESHGPGPTARSHATTSSPPRKNLCRFTLGTSCQRRSRSIIKSRWGSRKSTTNFKDKS